MSRKYKVFKQYKQAFECYDDVDFTLKRKMEEAFPEISHLSNYEFAKRFHKTHIDVFTEEEEKVQFWIRLTAPFALITWALLILSMPFKFMITGKATYNKLPFIERWFDKLFRSY